MSESRKRYEGSFFQYVSSYDGKAVFNVVLCRMTRKRTREYLRIDVELSRSSVGRMVRELKAFADKEREQVGGLPL